MSHVYEYRSIASPRPYYHYPDTGETLWVRKVGYIVDNPPDGKYIPPPRGYSTLNNTLTRTHSIRSRTLTVLPIIHAKQISDMSIQTKDATDINPILIKDYERPMSFYNNPFFPPDLYLLPDSNYIIDFLKQNMNILKEGMVKKEKIPFETTIRPGKKSINKPLLVITPKTSPLAKSLFKTFRLFIAHDDVNSIPQFIQYIDGNPNMLIPEAAIQLLTETNSSVITPRIRNAWKLFQIFISRYELPYQYKKIIRAYFSIAASQSDVSNEIKDNATLCMLRLSCTSQIKCQYDSTSPQYFISHLTSPTVIFGVSLPEILWKERMIDGRNKDNPNLVPKILRKLIGKLKQLNVFHTKEVFMRAGSVADEISAIQNINNGNWEIDDIDVYTVASITKQFFIQLQDPILTREVYHGLADSIPSYKCISLANSLPNESLDTLMYFIGFLQELVTHIGDINLTYDQLITAVSHIFSRDQNPTILSGNAKMARALERFVSMLVQNWNTDEIYTLTQDY